VEIFSHVSIETYRWCIQ